MACGACAKRKAAQEQLRVQRAQARSTETQAKASPSVQSYRKLRYLISSADDLDTILETHGTLAAAQASIRSMGPGFVISTSRP